MYAYSIFIKQQSIKQHCLSAERLQFGLYDYISIQTTLAVLHMLCLPL